MFNSDKWTLRNNPLHHEDRVHTVLLRRARNTAQLMIKFAYQEDQSGLRNSTATSTHNKSGQRKLDQANEIIDWIAAIAFSCSRTVFQRYALRVVQERIISGATRYWTLLSRLRSIEASTKFAFILTRSACSLKIRKKLHVVEQFEKWKMEQSWTLRGWEKEEWLSAFCQQMWILLLVSGDTQRSTDFKWCCKTTTSFLVSVGSQRAFSPAIPGSALGTDGSCSGGRWW